MRPAKNKAEKLELDSGFVRVGCAWKWQLPESRQRKKAEAVAQRESHSRCQQHRHSWPQWAECKGGSKKRSCCKKLAQIYDATYFFLFSLWILGIRKCELVFILSLSLCLSLALSLSRLSLYKQRFFRKLITPNLCILRANFLCNVTFIVAAQWQLGVSGESLRSCHSCHKVRARVRPLYLTVPHCACKWKKERESLLM